MLLTIKVPKYLIVEKSRNLWKTMDFYRVLPEGHTFRLQIAQ